MKINVNYDVLVWARETKGLSAEQAAKKSKIDLQRLEWLESGKDMPTLDELKKLAKTYNQTIATLQLYEPPRQQKKERSLRQQFAVKALTRIKEMQDKKNKLTSLGVDLTNYDDGVELLEEAVALLFSDNDAAMEDVQWWLYEKADKVITLKDKKKLDLTKVEDFVNWLDEWYTYSDEYYLNLVNRWCDEQDIDLPEWKRIALANMIRQ